MNEQLEEIELREKKELVEALEKIRKKLKEPYLTEWMNYILIGELRALKWALRIPDKCILDMTDGVVLQLNDKINNLKEKLELKIK